MAGTATEPLVGRTAIELAAAVREGRASPQDVVEAHLEWIESLDRSIHAFQVVRPDGVREEARALASRVDLRELPLAGVPVAIKDNLEMAGYATRNGTLARDRKSTRLNSSHPSISYAVFCLKKKNKNNHNSRTKKKNKQNNKQN